MYYVLRKGQKHVTAHWQLFYLEDFKKPKTLCGVNSAAVGIPGVTPKPDKGWCSSCARRVVGTIERLDKDNFPMSEHVKRAYNDAWLDVQEEMAVIRRQEAERAERNRLAKEAHEAQAVRVANESSWV